MFASTDNSGQQRRTGANVRTKTGPKRKMSKRSKEKETKLTPIGRLITLVMILMVGAIAGAAGAAATRPHAQAWRCITVRPGETLWGIASHNPSPDTRDV